MHDHQLDTTHCIFLGFAEGGGVVEGCCCPSPDGIVCVAIRYNQEVEDVDEPCECHCHFQAERRFGQGEDDFYFDVDDDLDEFDDDGNRHNEMWDSPLAGDIYLATAIGVSPDELGDLHNTNHHGHESREEAYRKRFGL